MRRSMESKKGRTLKIARRIRAMFFILLAMTLALPGCALRNQTSANVAPVASVAPRKTPHCSDRVDRSKTGGFVGGVLGTVAASLVGSPLVGVFYRAAGYVIGFASENPQCPKAGSASERNGSVNGAEPSSSAVIVEEEL